MSFPCGSTGPFFSVDRHLRDEIAAHRDKVFAALSQHSDPAVREIGRLLARGTVTPHRLLENPRHADALNRTGRKPRECSLEALRRQVFGPTVPFDTPLDGMVAATGAPTAPVSASDGMSDADAGTRPSREAGPASRADFTDPDNGAGGVPAIRR